VLFALVALVVVELFVRLVRALFTCVAHVSRVDHVGRVTSARDDKLLPLIINFVK
jgi:hypothetical protein